MSDVALILGVKIKIRMLVSLLKSGPMLKTVLYDCSGHNALNARKLVELEDAGLIAMEVNRFQNNQTTVSLTSIGISVAKKLIEIDHIISGTSSGEDSTTNHGTPSEVLDPLNTSE